jgi:predicted secreted protein
MWRAGGPDADPGAPIVIQKGRKLIWSTAISAVISAIANLAFSAGYLNIERLSKLMGIPL